MRTTNSGSFDDTSSDGPNTFRAIVKLLIYARDEAVLNNSTMLAYCLDIAIIQAFEEIENLSARLPIKSSVPNLRIVSNNQESFSA